MRDYFAAYALAFLCGFMRYKWKYWKGRYLELQGGLDEVADAVQERRIADWRRLRSEQIKEKANGKAKGNI